MASRRRKRSFTSISRIAVALACLVAYANAFGNAFVAGDLQFIQNNSTLAGDDVLVNAFARGYWWVGQSQESGTYYRPFVVLLDAWDKTLWGNKPFGFHLTNLLLHIAVSLVVLRLTRAWTRSPITAAAAAILFAVHPLHVHAVTYISARSALLCTLFYSAAVLLAIQWRRAALLGRARPRELALIAACFVGGLLSLEAAITLPVALAFVLFPPADRRRAWAKKLWPLAVALGALGLGYFAVRRAALGTLLSQKEALTHNLPPLESALTIVKTLGYYAVKLVVPTDVSYLPPFLPVLRPADPLGIAAVIGVAAALFAWPRRWRVERAATLWVLLTLMPVAGFMPLDHFVKGQYAYLPSVGFCVLAASLVRRAIKAARRRWATWALGGALGAAALAFTVLTMVENRYWRDTESLFGRVMALEGQIPDEVFAHPVMTPTANRFSTVHLTVAGALVEAKDCPRAREHAERAAWLTRRKSVKLQARQLEAHCLFVTERYDEALAAYLPLVDDAPSDRMAPERAAFLLLRQGKTKEATPYLAIACQRGSKEACAEVQRPAGP